MLGGHAINHGVSASANGMICVEFQHCPYHRHAPNSSKLRVIRAASFTASSFNSFKVDVD